MIPNDSFRILVLDCPYDSWETPETKEWFGKIIELKLKGYRREYPYGVLPMDTSDFIATHLIIAKDSEAGLEPVMAYRSVSQDRCQKHSISLPVLSLMKQLAAAEHAAEIQKIIDHCASEKTRLCYASSLAVAEEYAGHPELKEILKMVNVCHTREDKVSEILAGGVLRFKMDRFYSFMGYNKLAHNGSPLEALKIPFACNELTGFFHLKEFSDEAKEIAKKYEYLWAERIILGKPSKTNKTLRAA